MVGGLAAAVAVSTHPVTAVATGEAAGQLLEQGFGGADVVCCFVTASHAGAMEDVAAALETLLHPAVLLGAASAGVLGGATMVSEGPGVVLWAATGAPAAGWLVDGGENGPRPPVAAGLVLAPQAAPRVYGGSGVAAVAVAPARAAGGPLLVLDGLVVRDGPVGVALDPTWGLATSVTTGVRTIGPPVRVTGAQGSLVTGLDGVDALARLERLARDEVPAADARRLNHGLVVVVPTPDGPVPVPVAGADRARGALALGPGGADPHPAAPRWEIAAETVVRFGVADAETTTGEVHDVLAREAPGAALVFPPFLGDGPIPWMPAGVAGAVAGCVSDGARGPDGAVVHRGVATVACFKGIGFSSPAR